PYFVRFLRTPAGQNIASLYTHRAAVASASLTNLADADSIAETSQFLATLLLIQGISDIDPKDKEELLPHLKAWVRKPAFRGRLASDASERVVWLLTEDRNMTAPLAVVRSKLQASLERCDALGCTKTCTNAELQKCSRCKSALFMKARIALISWRWI
ncbi:hypothetical protein BC835DRAFT_1305443, partial [Cytidiella melzeri]